MLDPRNLDIHKLHDVTEHIIAGTVTTLPHQVGVTTAYLYLMLGEAWMGQSNQNYIYVGEYPQTAYLDFVSLLLYENIEIDQLHSVPYSKIILKNSQTFNFWSKEQAINDVYWIGTSYNKIFFDEDLYVFCTDDRQGLLNNVYFSGAVLI